MKINVLLSLAMLCLLAACVAPKTVPPNSMWADIPAQWSAPGGTAAVSAGWWKAFGDPLLEQHVQDALAHNTDLRLAMARVAEARALSVAQHAVTLPTVDVGTAGFRTREIFDVTGQPYSYTGSRGQVQLAYEVDLWGRLAALSDASDAAVAASRAARDATALAVASSTAAAYINLCVLDERLAITRRTLIARQAALHLARQRSATGFSSAFELAQAEAEYRNTAQAIPQLELAKKQQQHALRVLVGGPPGPVEHAPDLASLATPAVPTIGVPSKLLRRRPDIAVAEARVAESDAELAAARAQLLPSLNLGLGVSRVTSSALLGDPFTLWTAGASILAPIFNGGRLRAQVDAHASRRDQALISYRKSVLTAFAEVEDQLAAIEQLRLQGMEADAQRVAVADALRIARNRYREGYASYLEELDAQRTLYGAEQTVAQLRADLLTAHVNLYRALGGGWQPGESE